MTPRSNKSTYVLIALGLLLILGLGTFVYNELARDRVAAEARLRTELEAQAQLAESAVMERIRKIDIAILSLRVSITTHGFSNIARILSSLNEAGLLDIATAIVVTNAEGKVLLQNGHPPAKPVSIADRDYFTALRAETDTLVISEPYGGRVSGNKAIVIARRLNDPGGKFSGIIAIGTKPETLLGSGLPERNSNQEVLTLISDQGVILSRSRDHELFLGKHIDSSALAVLRSNDAAYAVRASPTDNRVRAHASRKVSGMPLYVVVGDTFDDVETQLAPRRHTLLISSAMITALLLLLLWQAWRFAQRRIQKVHALATLKSQLELAQGVAGVGSWVWDVPGNHTSASHQLFELMGIPPDRRKPEFNSFIAFVPEAERPDIIAAFRILIKSGRIEYEHHIQRPDGELRLLAQNAHVTERGTDGRAITVIGTCRDITEEKRNQAQLKAREQRLDAIISSLAEGVVVRDRKGRITLINDAAAKLSLQGDHHEGTIWDMLDEHGNKLPQEQYPAMLSMSSGIQIDQQLYGIHVPGKQLTWVRISTRLLDSTDGDGDAVVTSFTDVTRLRDAEREGRLAAAVFTQVSQPVVITDGDARILRINRAFTDAFGYTAEETVGNTTNMLRSMRHEGLFYETLWQQLKTEGYWRGEIWNRHKNGEAVPFLSSITRISEPVSRETRYVTVYADLHGQKTAENALRWQANHDGLTGLPNRRLLTDRMQIALAQAKRKNIHLATVYIDLDSFKPINDNYGHLAGDFLLQTVADRMLSVLRASDSLGRVGGDEFIAVLGEINDMQDTHRVLTALLEAVAESIKWEGVSLKVTCSIGVAFWPKDGNEVAELIVAADAAMYCAKAAGGGRIAFAGEAGNIG